MHFDFSTVEDDQSYTSVPEGTYVCRVAEVRVRESRDGSERWSLRLDVDEGDWAGRCAAWDSVTWSERGVHRVKSVLRALGFEVSGVVDVDPNDLVGVRTRVELVTERWENPVTGVREERRRVPYNGYASLEDHGEVLATGQSRQAESSTHGTDRTNDELAF